MDYNSITLLELKKLCKERKLKGYSNKNKNEIIELLNSPDEPKSEILKPLDSPENTEFKSISLELNKKLSKEIRQENGIYFTPKKARTKIFDFLNLKTFTPKNCLEPSFGSGEFIQDLLEKYPNSDVVGVEKNTVIFDSVKGLFPKAKLLNLDFLDFRSKDSENKFDLIIGNPPYFVMKDKKDPLIKECMNGRANIFVLFIYKCLTQHLNTDGILAFVLPTSFYNCSYYELCRKYIYENTSILLVENITVNYVDTNQDTMIMILQNKKPEDFSHEIPYILKINERIFINPYYSNLQKLLSNSTTFEKLGFTVKTGEVVWNQHKEILTNDPKDSTLIIYSHNIQDKNIVLDTDKKDKKQYISKDFNGTPSIGPALLISRGYGNKYKLDYTFVEKNVVFYGENHINVILPNIKSEALKIEELLNKIKSSLEDERTSKFIEMYIGNGALSKTEIETIFPLFLK